MDGIGERGAPRPNMYHGGQSHEALKGMTDPAEPGISAEIAAQWRSMGQSLAQAGILLQQAVVGSESGWTGLAADGMRYRLGQVVDWSLKASENFANASTAVDGQSSAVGDAKTRMPEPVPYDPAQLIKDAQSDGLFGMIALPNTLYAQHQKSQAAHEEAIRVVSARDAQLALYAATIPSFLPPPSLSDAGDTGDDDDGGGPGPGPGGGGSGGDGGTGVGGTGGGSGLGFGSGSGSGGAPGPTGQEPIAPAPIGPTQPGPGLTNPDQYVPGPPGGAPSLPPTGIGTGTGAPTGGPGFGPGAGFVPGPGFGPGGGGGGAGAGGGGSARGAGPGAGGSGRGPGGATGMGPGGAAASEAAAGRGASGARGAAGTGGMPMGAGRGQGGDDKEHQRPTYLQEADPDALFGTDEMTAPPVIGEE